MKQETHRTLCPLGEELTQENILCPKTTRWTARRKAELVNAVQGGLIPVENIWKTYRVTPEEFEAWEKKQAKNGLSALRITLTQHYREKDKQSPFDP